MKILIAADKFKGSMSASQACAAMGRGVASIFSGAEIVLKPVADGGEGTAEAMRDALGGEAVVGLVQDPLRRPVEAAYAIVEESGGRTAVIEMSAASGLWLLRDAERNPRAATTFGTGQLITDAVRRGVQKIIVGLGGSATNDGGTGMAEALGYRFHGVEGILLEDLPLGLEGLRSIEAPVDLVFPAMVVACDVTNPLLGECGATRVYGAQKGVREEEVTFHEERLRHLAEVVERDLGKAVCEEPGAGAAGGLGFGLLAFCGATLRSGFALVSETIGLEAAVRGADLVLTGEGRIDAQTGQGKAPAGVAALARRSGIPVVAFGGSAEKGEAGEENGIFDAVETIEARHPGLALAESKARGEELIEEVVKNSGDVLKKALQGG